MSHLTESIVDGDALEWFGELGYAVGHGPQMAPGEPAAERNSFSEVMLCRVAPSLIPAFSHRAKDEDREAIRRLNPAIPEEARATGKRYFQVRMERRQKS